MSCDYHCQTPAHAGPPGRYDTDRPPGAVTALQHQTELYDMMWNMTPPSSLGEAVHLGLYATQAH